MGNRLFRNALRTHSLLTHMSTKQYPGATPCLLRGVQERFFYPRPESLRFLLPMRLAPPLLPPFFFDWLLYFIVFSLVFFFHSNSCTIGISSSGSMGSLRKARAYPRDMAARGGGGRITSPRGRWTRVHGPSNWSQMGYWWHSTTDYSLLATDDCDHHQLLCPQ